MTRRAKASPEDEALRAQALVALGRRIREARQRSGLTQDQVAEAIGVTKGYVFEIEGRGANLSFESLLRVARVLKVSLRDLMPRTEHDEPTTLDDLAALALDDLAAAVAQLSGRLGVLERLGAETGGMRDEIAALVARVRSALPPRAGGSDGEGA